MSQTMLLTKRLSTVLASNANPQLHTLLLLSPTGKLLSSSSPSTASTLRTQATLACSLWSLYNSSNTSALASSALSTSSSQTSPQPPHSSSGGNDLSTITIQLTQGIMVILALPSGLLFVAIGPSTAPSPDPSSQLLRIHSHAAPSHISPPASPAAQTDGHRSQASLNVEALGAGGLLGVDSGAPSDAGSIMSVGAQATQASIPGIRRQAEEVGRWLEGKLEGFVLNAWDGR